MSRGRSISGFPTWRKESGLPAASARASSEFSTSYGLAATGGDMLRARPNPRKGRSVATGGLQGTVKRRRGGSTPPPQHGEDGYEESGYSGIPLTPNRHPGGRMNLERSSGSSRSRRSLLGHPSSVSSPMCAIRKVFSFRSPYPLEICMPTLPRASFSVLSPRVPSCS